MPLLLPRLEERVKLILVSVVVGLGAGLAAVALSQAIRLTEHALAGVHHSPWAFVLPGAGGLLSYLFLRYVAREQPGHGVPEVIESVSRYGGQLRTRSTVSRLVSSCLTIGSGGSAGPEAPVVMSGAAIGSNIARVLRMNDRHRTTLVGAGAAAAISAIFNAPIAGMIFSVEVILGEWTSVNIVPIAIASVAGTLLSHVFQGNQIPFPHTAFHVEVIDVLAAAGLAIATAGGSLLFTYVLRLGARTWQATRIPMALRVALGGCAVGGIGLWRPEILGEGYAAIDSMITARFEQHVLVLATLIVLKMLATTTTLGSGGSGGLFAPSLVVGSLIGVTFHEGLVTLWPDLPWVGVGCFALLGMAGLMGGILQAPLTGVFLVLEITGSYNVILPLLVVSAVSFTVCRLVEPASIYLRDLAEHGDLLRPGTDARVLADLRVRELIEHDAPPLDDRMTLGDLVRAIQASPRNHFPVQDALTGSFIGLVRLDDVRHLIFDTTLYDTVLLSDLVDSAVPRIVPDSPLDEVLATMDRAGLFVLPVVEAEQWVGFVSKGSLLDYYRKELIVQTSE